MGGGGGGGGETSNPPIVLQLGGQKGIKRKPLTISMCKPLLETGQQLDQHGFFTRKEVTVCFLQVNYKLLLPCDQKNRLLNIKSLP